VVAPPLNKDTVAGLLGAGALAGLLGALLGALLIRRS